MCPGPLIPSEAIHFLALFVQRETVQETVHYQGNLFSMLGVFDDVRLYHGKRCSNTFSEYFPN